MAVNILIFISSEAIKGIDVSEISNPEYISINGRTEMKIKDASAADDFCDFLYNFYSIDDFSELDDTEAAVINCGAERELVNRLAENMKLCNKTALYPIERILPLAVISKRQIAVGEALNVSFGGKVYKLKCGKGGTLSAEASADGKAELALEDKDFFCVFDFKVPDVKNKDDEAKIKELLDKNNKLADESRSMARKYHDLDEKMKKTDDEMRQKISVLQDTIGALKEENIKLADAAKAEEKRAEEIENKIVSIVHKRWGYEKLTKQFRFKTGSYSREETVKGVLFQTAFNNYISCNEHDVSNEELRNALRVQYEQTLADINGKRIIYAKDPKTFTYGSLFIVSGFFISFDSLYFSSQDGSPEVPAFHEPRKQYDYPNSDIYVGELPLESFEGSHHPLVWPEERKNAIISIAVPIRNVKEFMDKYLTPVAVVCCREEISAENLLSKLEFYRSTTGMQPCFLLDMKQLTDDLEFKCKNSKTPKAVNFLGAQTSLCDLGIHCIENTDNDKVAFTENVYSTVSDFVSSDISAMCRRIYGR